MSREIVMLHGANCGGWCFDRFRPVFEEAGWTCHAPDLFGHGDDMIAARTRLVGIGLADYRKQMETYLRSFATPPVLLGHSMGAVIAQQLASAGLARALVLISPAPRERILPHSEAERKLALDLMSLGDFRHKVLDPIFPVAAHYSLNRVPAREQYRIFARFGPESGRALFDIFFWMFDEARAAAVDASAVKCPVLCLSGSDDRLVSIGTARAAVAEFEGSEFWELPEHGHMVVLEPGADAIAARIVAWLGQQP